MIYLQNYHLSGAGVSLHNGINIGATGWKLVELTNYTMQQTDRLILRDDANGVEFLSTTAYQDIPANSPVDVHRFMFYWTEQPSLNTIEVALYNNSGTADVEVSIKDAEFEIV